MTRLRNLSFRGDASTSFWSFTVVAVCEIGSPFSDMAGFPEPGSYLLPTGLENFWRRDRLTSGVAVLAGTRFFVLPRDVSERS